MFTEGSIARLCNQTRGVRGDQGRDPNLQLKSLPSQDLGRKCNFIPGKDHLQRSEQEDEANHSGSHSAPRPEGQRDHRVS